METQSKRLLILEHDRDVAKMLDEALKAEGFAATSLVDDLAFLAEVQKLQPDLVIVDVMGTEHDPDCRVLNALRADNAVKGVPIITMGTSARMGKILVASNNARGFLLKPFDLEELYDKVYQVMGTHSDPCKNAGR